MKNYAENVHQKLVPDPLFILVNNLKQPLHALNSFKTKIFWKRIIKNLSLLVIYYLTKFDGVIQSSFWVIPNIAPANLCKSIYDIINYSTSVCPFESGRSGKEQKKLQKFEYLENEKSFSDEIKKLFSQFLKGYH